jgi:hypothetical protein
MTQKSAARSRTSDNEDGTRSRTPADTKFVALVTAAIANDENFTFDTTPMPFDGIAGTRARHERALKGQQERLYFFLKSYPREGNETPSAWFNRVRASVRDSGRVFHVVGRLYAIISRKKDEEELERMQRADKAKLKHKSLIASLKHQASPDADEVAKLQATIEAAKQHEQLLASLFEAFNAHTQAQEARKRLAIVFDSIEGVRSTLRDHNEHVPTVTIKRPQVPDAPAGAIEFAKEVARVKTLLRPI